jgi:hypothetical protein
MVEVKWAGRPRLSKFIPSAVGVSGRNYLKYIRMGRDGREERKTRGTISQSSVSFRRDWRRIGWMTAFIHDKTRVPDIHV